MQHVPMEECIIYQEVLHLALVFAMAPYHFPCSVMSLVEVRYIRTVYLHTKQYAANEGYCRHLSMKYIVELVL